MITRRIFYFLFLLLITNLLNAQQKLTIGISKDADTKEFVEFSRLLSKEISGITSAKYDIQFKELTGNWNPKKINDNNTTLMNDNNIDIVITLGYISSTEISKLSNFSKPVIAANILDRDLQKLPLKSGNTTGIYNFTYIEPVIRLKDDFLEFSKIFKAKETAIFVPKVFKENFPQIIDFFKMNAQNTNVSFVFIDTTGEDAISQINDNVDAAVILPLIKFPLNEIEHLFDSLNKKQIPSLAVSGLDYLEKGATLTLTPKFTFQQLARQLALRVLKITEGLNPSQLPVTIESMRRVPIINMAGLREISKFPEWNLLNESVLINASKFPNGKEINFRLVVAEALANNLKGKISRQDVLIADKNVQIAKSNLLPQVSVGGSTVWLSENLVEASMGQRGSFTLNGSASLKQVLFSETVFANIKINKLLADSKKYFDEQTVLDLITQASGAYIALLFSKSNLLIQNQNVNATIENLQAAKAKEEVGQSGLSDVNRWISELNLNKIKFNDAYTAFRSNMYELNKQLNSPIDLSINIPDSNSIDKTIILNQDLLNDIFKNPILTERYASFIIAEMLKNSPEIKQLAALAKIAERKTALYKRSWFMPEVALMAGADQAFIRNGTIQPPNMPVPSPPDDMTYNAAISLKIPIFQGGKSSNEMKKSVIELDKINYQKNDLLNQLESTIRTSVQRLRTSYLELDLSANAALAAENNFKIIQDAYFQGTVNLIQLIDAQNVMIKTKNMANIAYYQYVLDYIQTQRLQGKFMFLASKEEQQTYTDNMRAFLFAK